WSGSTVATIGAPSAVPSRAVAGSAARPASPSRNAVIGSPDRAAPAAMASTAAVGAPGPKPWAWPSSSSSPANPRRTPAATSSGSAASGRAEELSVSRMSHRPPRDGHAPDRRALLQVLPPELARVLELELVAQRLRVVVVDQGERLA